MKYEEWIDTLNSDEQAIFKRLIAHNMSLTKGHNGNMYVTKGYLEDVKWNDSNYHYSSVEFENYLMDKDVTSANYPLINNSPNHRWSTSPYKREI